MGSHEGQKAPSARAELGLGEELMAIAGDALGDAVRGGVNRSKRTIGSFLLTLIIVPVGVVTLFGSVVIGWLIGSVIGFESDLGHAIPIGSIVVGVILATIVSARVWKRRPAWIGRWIEGEDDSEPLAPARTLLAASPRPAAAAADRTPALAELDARFARAEPSADADTG
jgi:hypothetical protein